MQSERSPRAAHDGGFTLVEIMVVIVILGMLAAIVGQNVLGSAENAEISTAKQQITNIKGAVELYMIENRRRIPTWEDLITPDNRGHRYLETEDPLQDPWGNEYDITTDPEYQHKPLIVSYGPDGIEGTEDDITSKNLTAKEEN